MRSTAATELPLPKGAGRATTISSVAPDRQWSRHCLRGRKRSFRFGQSLELGLPALLQTASNETVLRLAQMKGTLCSTGLIACPFHLQLKRAAGPGPPFGDHVSRRQGQGYLFAGDGLKQPTADRSVDERRRDRPTARRLNMVVARSRADVVGPDAFVVGAHRVPAGSAEHDALEESRALARGPRPVVRAIGRQPLLDPEVGLPTDVSLVMVLNHCFPLLARDLDGPRSDDAFGVDPALGAAATVDIGAGVAGVLEQVQDPPTSQPPPANLSRPGATVGSMWERAPLEGAHHPI